MKKKRSDMLLLGSLAVLLVFSLYNTVRLLKPPTAFQITVTNRKTELYDAARIPEMPSGGNLNINTADAELLDTLPGIGPTLAGRIVEHREKYGAFVHPALITTVSGIGEGIYEKIKALIFVEQGGNKALTPDENP